ncbi:MAG: amidase [Pontimonas sp.]
MTIWHQESLAHHHDALTMGHTSAAELTEYYLERIEKFNPQLNAFVHVDPDYARKRAVSAQEQLGGPTATALTGLPTADKDLVQRAGMPTRYGSALTAEPPPSEHSDLMATWLDDVGAISVGKTATSEFGMAAATEALAMGPTRNPHDSARSAGGSSGGAAAAVAAGMLPFAPGSDGGGSIRIPALSCGLVGWKPSRGLAPAGSGFEFLGGLAVPGLITRSVEDLALAADHLVQGEWFWATRAPGEPGSYRARLHDAASPRRFGWTAATPWPKDWGITPDPLALQAFSRGRDALVDAGHELVEFDWQPYPGYADDFVTLWTANAASLPVPEGALEGLEPLTRFLVQEGLAVTGVQLVRALAGLRSFERETITSFAPFDAVLTPGLNGPAPTIGWYDQVDAWRNFQQQVQITPWTSFVNVAGLPALALPTDYSPEGMPLGVQLVGRAGGDGVVMALAAQIEQRLADAQRAPTGF